MSNLNERLQQSVPLIDSSSEESVIEPQQQSSAPAVLTTVASEDTLPNNASSARTSTTGRVSQFVNNVNINNIIQSNSFLHSDLGSFIEIEPQSNIVMSSATSQQNPQESMVMRATHNNNNYAMTSTNNHTRNCENHSHSNDRSNATVVNLQENNVPNDEIPSEPIPPNGHPEVPQNNLISLLISSLQSSIPFLLLLIAKIFHQHLLGFFIVLGFMTTLHWSNRNLVHQVELRDKKQNKKLILLIVFLLLNASFFFLIFKEYKLYNCLLIFLAPNVPQMDTWNLIWIVVCSDTIIKYITISLKAFVTMLPFKTVPMRKRGGIYSIIENLALFYRSLVPIHPWFLFLFYADKDMKKIDNITLNNNVIDTQTTEVPLINQESTTFLIFLCIFYSIFKFNQLYHMIIELRNSFKEIDGHLSSIRVGSNSNSETLNEDNICPICQDKLASPVILKCKHIFCEDCVCVWLDKENSCPMCRSKISVKKPKFKDGSTTVFIQWY